MKLHRVGKRADWDRLKARNRNNWQKVAVKTHGIITPGNIISMVGFGLVVSGLWFMYIDQVLLGVLMVGVGRLLDIADGMLADKTGTKSPLGEVVDATIDKAEIALALPVLVITQVLLPWQALVIVALHALNVVLIFITKVRGMLPHASQSGKYATTVQWVAIVLYGVIKNNPSLRSISWLSHAVFNLALILGLVTIYGYAKKAVS